MPKWLTIVGARPNFIKLAALHRAFGKVDSVAHYIVHTGQHYDYEMNELFFQQLAIPRPDCHLGIGSGSRSDQIGRTLLALEPILREQQPQWVVVVGDVNATVAGAIAARNLDLKLAHVEAGMRSFDWRMPEEINRIITDRLSDLLLVSEPAGVDNLLQEGVGAERIHDTGNVMIDTLLAWKPLAAEIDHAALAGFSKKGYAVATLHRAENTNRGEILLAWMNAFERISETLPILFPLHPRTRKQLDSMSYEPRSLRLRLIEPQGYLNMMALMMHARAVLSDSGGIQAETTALGVPCFTLRDSTEWPVTVRDGTNTLVGCRPDRLPEIIQERLSRMREPRMPERWDGKSSERIARLLVEWADAPLRTR